MKKRSDPSKVTPRNARKASVLLPEIPLQQTGKGLAVSDMIRFFISALIAMIRQDAGPVVLDPHVCELIAGKSAGAKSLSVAVTEIDR